MNQQMKIGFHEDIWWHVTSAHIGVFAIVEDGFRNCPFWNDRFDSKHIDNSKLKIVHMVEQIANIMTISSKHSVACRIFVNLATYKKVVKILLLNAALNAILFPHKIVYSISAATITKTLTNGITLSIFSFFPTTNFFLCCFYNKERTLNLFDK